MPHPDAIRILAVIAFIVLILCGIKRPIFGAIGYMILVYAKLSFYYPVLASLKSELLPKSNALLS